MDANYGGMPNYMPNSFCAAKTDARYKECPMKAAEIGDVDRHDASVEDNFSQVAVFYSKVLTEAERERLCRNIAGHIKDAQPFIQERLLGNLDQVSKDYGDRVRKALRDEKV